MCFHGTFLSGVTDKRSLSLGVSVSTSGVGVTVPKVTPALRTYFPSSELSCGLSCSGVILRFSELCQLSW